MKKFTLWLLFAFCALVANADEAYTIYLKIDGTHVTESSTVKIHVWDCTKYYTEGKDWPNYLPVLSNIVTDNNGTKYYTYQLEDNDANFNFLYIFDGIQKGNFNAKGNVISSYDGNSVTNTSGSPSFTKVYLKGASYNDWKGGADMVYDSGESAFVYTETTTSYLANDFKICVNGSDWIRYEHNPAFNLGDSGVRDYEEIKYIEGNENMKINDANSFSSITIKVKKVDGIWKMRVEGTKESTEDLISARWRGLSYNNWTNNNFTKKADGSFTYVVESPAGLANDWGVDITENGSTWTWYRLPDENYPKVGTDVTLVAESTPNSKQIKITDAANYGTVTLTLKKVEGNWVLSTSGTAKTHTVTMKGAAWGNWESNKFTFTKQDDGTYAYTFTGNDVAGLAQEFAFTIDNKDYSNRTDLEVNTEEAYTMATGQYEKNYKIPTAADYSNITLTVAFSDGTPSLKVTGTEIVVTYPDKVTIVGAMTDWAAKTYTIPHKGNGIYEGNLDTRTTSGQWRIYEEWDGNLESENSWGYDVDQEGDMLSGTFTKGMTGSANTTTKKLWLLTFNINTGEWSLEEDKSGVESIDNEGVKIVAGKGAITVSGATNVEVYTAGGALVSREAESHVAAGLYIVRTDNKVAKVIVR